MRAFSAASYPAVRRVCDSKTGRYSFQQTTTDKLTRPMRQQQNWHVAGWKLHIAVYPADYTQALLALRAFEERFEITGLVYKYAASRQSYENFTGAVRGKFATIYCTAPSDIPPTLELVNHFFGDHGITPLNRRTIDSLEGLRYELPLLGGFGFVRYGAFSYQRELLDLSDPQREPLVDDRCRPFPEFSDPDYLVDELVQFNDLIATRSGETPR